MAAEYVIGIDLGTTNSVLAYVSLSDPEAKPKLLAIPQLVAAGTIESKTTLPSFLYLPARHEPKAAFGLPWQPENDFVVGQMARSQAADVPDRTVGAAKSWLCHSRVDRNQPILPWNAPADVPKVSPVEAACRYLKHLKNAWEAAFPNAQMAEQQVVLTVPASFDASARELTHQAAIEAGLPASLVLLEEPQAAVYSWLSERGDEWRRSLKTGDSLLVCDVGGGTTDLTLVEVSEEDGGLVLRRRAVGNHLLVGGDNMDLALAHHVAGLFAERGTKLDPWQSVALWHSCRTAKEALLKGDGAAKHPVSVLGRGSKLIGGTISIDVGKDDVLQILVDGFFPKCGLQDRPAARRGSGFQEIGLPFEADTAVTRHLASFLHSHGEGPERPARPTHVLFNGGVFKADAMQTRLLEVMADWFGQADAPKMLEGTHDLDHAAARGAAYYGWAKRSGGIRIRGGTARAYYVGIETSGPAIPGAPRPLRAHCVVPIGMEEGTEMDVPSGEIGLVVGEPAHFRFFSSSVRTQDRPGDILDRWDEDELSETDSLEATLAAEETGGTAPAMPYVPVRFHAKITELGMFELWCVATQNERRWKLEFSVREDAGQ